MPDEVMDESSRADLVPRLELPYVHGVQLGWCELLTHITISELADLAKALALGDLRGEGLRGVCSGKFAWHWARWLTALSPEGLRRTQTLSGS